MRKRIREIRLSERVFYQKIKDIYVTSIDYDSQNGKMPHPTFHFLILQS
ncbi:MAG: virulence RhuM family protein [Opitutaceae bacterium]|nr:virulence RhuM family protein [Opitutaceae bacterium]